ncbi:DUF1189 domain-containing protein [Sporosarcina sp. ANT_H38]|uniref:DUF1189 family protein n=1 Tax=Sporosarcina sp. ANT_H38 TaxID=2597358 RepID=UPI0011F2F61F|nr:DUF1189 family protein [Sporosarcina sp. ANT_H38]KAA0966070.1 DUF1189 domain-containing protein [Sporosarcina sp. ANT_H38]
MKFHQLFKAAIHEPKKLAAFRLLPIGKVFRYVFIFVALFTLLSFIRYIAGDAVLFEASPELIEHGETIGGLIYPIAFLLQLVISTSYIFIRISIFGYVGILLLKLMKRRGEYRHMWRTSAIAITIPIVLTIGFDFLPAMKNLSTVITSGVHLAYITVAAKYYPKIPQ